MGEVYRATDTNLKRVALKALPESFASDADRAVRFQREAEVPAALFQTRIVGGGTQVGLTRQYDVGPDGRFLINAELDAPAAPITLLMNWNPDARR
jgi:serine/threonine protein kinase